MYISFKKWLDNIIQNNKFDNVKAFNFNLYEDIDENDRTSFSMQLIGAPLFDSTNDDWACNEVYSSGENLFTINNCEDWEECLDIAKRLISRYLSNNKSAVVLTKADVVAVGFVDGDLHVISCTNQGSFDNQDG